VYYFIRWKHTEEGYAPDIPEDVSFLLLAEPGRACDGAEFALFRCRLPDAYESPENVHPVSDELVELLQAAEDYPPALALTREDLDRDESRSETEDYQVVIYRRQDVALSGDLFILVDRNTGEVLYVLHGA
jgi:hypothetical protein